MIWVAAFAIPFDSKTKEGEDVNKYACRLLSKSGTQTDYVDDAIIE